MIEGVVTNEGEPIVTISVAGQDWPALVDTGFNGDLELPDRLRPFVNARPRGRVYSLLAAGQRIEEDVYRVDFPFHGKTVAANATFVSGTQILIGTHLLRRHRLTIDFLAQTVVPVRAA